MKIVINNCYGGFSLSEKQVLRYAEIKGIAVYPEKEDSLWSGIKTFWLVPKEERVVLPKDYEWDELPLKKKQKLLALYNDQVLSPRDIERNDPALVQVVEEGIENSRFSELKVVEIPDDVDWEVLEYDGNEWVAEKHRTWS